MKRGSIGKNMHRTKDKNIEIPPLTDAQLRAMQPLSKAHPRTAQKLRASQAGKTKITIRLDNAVLNYFRGIVNAAGGGNYQTLINEALVDHIKQKSVLDAVRQVVREELHERA